MRLQYTLNAWRVQGVKGFVGWMSSRWGLQFRCDFLVVPERMLDCYDGSISVAGETQESVTLPTQISIQKFDCADPAVEQWCNLR